MAGATQPVDILILGAGWTSEFLLPLCGALQIPYAATNRSGDSGADNDPRIKFAFDPESEDPGPYKDLPDATTVLVTFPIKVSGATSRLVKLYNATHSNVKDVQFIQLGSSSIWDGTRNALAAKDVGNKWYDHRTPWSPGNERGQAEEELLKLGGTVLNLSGLWGGKRDPRNWLWKVAPTKDALALKGSLHLIHGLDLARAILAVHSRFDRARGQRWLLTDLRVYDWWDLASAWGRSVSPPVDMETSDSHPHARWVTELLEERGVRALPRAAEILGRALDARAFWRTFEISPEHPLLTGRLPST